MYALGMKQGKIINLIATRFEFSCGRPCIDQNDTENEKDEETECTQP